MPSLDETVEGMIEARIAPLRAVQLDSNQRLRAIEEALGAGQAPREPEPEQELPAPEPEAPTTPAPPIPGARTNADIRAVVNTQMARATTAVLPEPAMLGWVAHFREPAFAELDEEAFTAAVYAQVLIDVVKYGWAPTAEVPVPPTPVPAPVPAAPPAADAVQSMIDDMLLPPDGVLKGVNEAYGWKHRAYNYMGNRPQASNTPAWWRNAHGGLFPGWWQSIIPWMVLFEGTRNQTTTPRVDVDWLRLYLRMGGVWTMLSAVEALHGWMQAQGGTYFGGSISPDWRNEQFSRSLRLVPNLNYHGYGSVSRLPDPVNIEAVHVKLRARLIGAEIDRSEWLIHVGADYYPVDRSPSVIVPAVAISRPKRVTAAWQDFTMTTFSDVATQEPGGGISRAAFIANPPPVGA
jgi:hypothetical protein